MAWIRSQNENLLIDAVLIGHLGDDESEFIYANTNFQNPEDHPKKLGMIIGDFKSLESAQSELSRIHQWIADGAKGVWQVGEDS